MQPLSFIPDDSEMGRRIGAFDWASTPVGAPEQWTPALKAIIRIALTTRHPIFVFWGPEHICFYNDAYSRSLGPEKHPSMLGIPARQAWPEIWHVIGPQIEHVMQGKGATWHENHLVPIVRNGRLEDVYWTYSYGPIDEASAPHGVGGVLVICTETTEQVTTGQRLALERARLAELFEQAPTFMAVLRGPTHVIELTNPGYTALIGGREVVGRTVVEALPEAVEQGYIELLDRVYTTGKAYAAFDAKYSAPSPNGDGMVENAVDFVYHPLRAADGSVDGIFVVGVDVSARRAVEQQLRRAEERMNLAVASSSLGTYDVDFATGAVTLSNKAAALFALPCSTTLDACLARVDPGDRAAVSAAIAAARASDGRYRVKHRILRPDGTVRWVDVAGQVASDAVVSDDAAGGGAPAQSMAGVLWDVTEQELLLGALREADRRKDEFLAVLAHELRNPLAPIRNAATMLLRPDLPADRYRWCGEMIDRHATTMALLLDDLLEVSRITTGKLQLKIDRVRLAGILDAALETARPAIEASRHVLEVVRPPEDIRVAVDPLRIAQCISNLLTNAAKYTPAGGRIAVRLSRVVTSVVIEVEDNGVGIPSGALSTIFEMFGQVDSTLGWAQGGLGIGLALSKGLVELHRGRLTAFSAGTGRGSVFRIELPDVVLAADEDPAASANGSEVSARGSGMLVLVADDNADAAHSLGVLLEMSGYRVLRAADGTEALRMALQWRPQAAILDIGMPEMDGYAVAERIRAHPEAAGMLLVAATGWGQAEDKRRAATAGFDAHLTKPLDFEEVQGLLEGVVPATQTP